MKSSFAITLATSTYCVKEIFQLKYDDTGSDEHPGGKEALEDRVCRGSERPRVMRAVLVPEGEPRRADEALP